MAATPPGYPGQDASRYHSNRSWERDARLSNERLSRLHTPTELSGTWPPTLHDRMDGIADETVSQHARSPITARNKEAPSEKGTDDTEPDIAVLSATSTAFEGKTKALSAPGALTRADNYYRVLGRLERIWDSPYFNIFIACCVTALPMVAFTITILSLVFANLKTDSVCPYADICPKMNGTESGSYYVDFPATQLVFVASWSSTVSLALTSFLMTLLSYTTARTILRSSADDSDGPSKLMTPSQLVILIKTLNGEMLAFWDYFLYRISHLRFFSRARRPRPSTAPVLSAALSFFFVALLASVLIQAADTWLHIATSTVTMTEVHLGSIEMYNYSRQLAPWCLNRNGVGTTCNVNFWGCAIECEEDSFGPTFGTANETSRWRVFEGTSSEHGILNYTDRADGSQYAVLGPANVNDTVDWSATTFGVSTTCSTIPPNACDSRLYQSRNESLNGELGTYNCTAEKSGLELAGEYRTTDHHERFMDFHRFLIDSSLFSMWNDSFVYEQIEANLPSEGPATPAMRATAADNVFRNPWQWAASRKLPSTAELSAADEAYLWDSPFSTGPFFMLSCYTTVFDLTYTATAGHVHTLTTKTPSNSTLTGTASMPIAPLLDFATLDYGLATFEIEGARSREEIISAYSLHFSKKALSYVASQTVPAPALRAQQRSSRLVAKVPRAALWSLVAANLGYAGLALGVTVMAVRALVGREDVCLLRTRLSVAGMVGEVFGEEGCVGGEGKMADEEWALRRGGTGSTVVSRVVVRKGGGSGGLRFEMREEALGSGRREKRS